MKWIAYFPWGDHHPPDETAYGPYDTREEAEAKARTLSTDPNEGRVMRLIEP